MFELQWLIANSRSLEPAIREVLNAIHSFSLATHQFLILPVLFFSIIFYLLALASIFIKPARRKNKKVEKWPFVTIQIPTFNEPVAIRCAEKCLEMDYPEDKFEIIIGDDSNDPKVSKLIDDFAKKHKKVKVVRRGTNFGFKAGNLNNMLKYSRGDIIVVFDSDFIPKKDFLKKVVQPFLQSKKVGCVQAKWGYLNMEENIISKFASTLLAAYHNTLAVINNNNKVSLLFGSAQAIRKDILLKLGGWQNWSLTEDVEFSLRVLENGYKILYLPDVKVDSEVPFTVRDLSRQQKKWAYGNMKAFIQHAKSIILSRKFSFKQKFLITFTTSVGYLFSFFLLLFLFFGILSFITGKPAPINIAEFLKTSLIMFFVASGFLATGCVSLYKEGKTKMLPLVILSSVTIGIVVCMKVVEGVMSAILGRKMDWLMVSKRGNENYFSK